LKFECKQSKFKKIPVSFVRALASNGNEMLKEATTRAEEADSKRTDCVKNINKEMKAAVNEAIDHERE
jgi:hypothetical protein